MPETIDLTPSWETTVRIYIEVLKNPDASPEGITAATEEITRLARFVDGLQSKKGE
jgi:hypothetical protein